MSAETGSVFYVAPYSDHELRLHREERRSEAEDARRAPSGGEVKKPSAAAGKKGGKLSRLVRRRESKRDREATFNAKPEQELLENESFRKHHTTYQRVVLGKHFAAIHKWIARNVSTPAIWPPTVCLT